jgi:hypothetical protein
VFVVILCSLFCNEWMKKYFKHNGIVVGRKCSYGLGFGCWSSFRECYVKDTGGRDLWDASRLFWVDEINIFVNPV